jgi:hypothetical protein
MSLDASEFFQQSFSEFSEFVQQTVERTVVPLKVQGLHEKPII